MTAVCLFRSNLRVADNLALHAAAREGAVVPVFVLDDVTPSRHALGRAARWWLHRSLGALGSSLESLGSGLVLLKGETASSVHVVLKECGAKSLHVQRDHAPWDRALEKRLSSMCRELGVDFRLHGDRVLYSPEETRNSQGNPFKVFTPFWRHCLSLPAPDAPCPAPARLDPPAKQPQRGLSLNDLRLEPRSSAWAQGFAGAWEPGEDGALRLLDRFAAQGAAGYRADRDRPGLEGGTSRLSPHIRFGEVGLRTLWRRFACAQDSQEQGAAAFLREIGWREFNYHLLHHFPKLPYEEFNPAYKDFPWSRAEREVMRKWSGGQTGYPLVDAGMRQLRETGWMHNRVRMVVASFLTKNLLVDWRDGAAWFWDSLVDADIASNYAGWQWVAGCGADAAPYFRIFNPVLQGRRFDPEGDYIRAYVPELGSLDSKLVHEPWTADVPDYPKPMVLLPFSRKRALDAYRSMRQTDEDAAVAAT